MSRPIAAPGLVDGLRAQVAPRVLKRVDAEPKLAEAWTWAADGRSVTTDGGETVTLRADPVTADAIGCTCLLSPKCAHVLAVAVALPAGGEAAAPAEPEIVAPVVELVRLERGQAAAAEAAWRCGSALLGVGALSAPSAVVDDLVRAAHMARAASLPRLAQAGGRLVRQLRLLRSRSAAASAPKLAEELAEWLHVAWALRRGPEVDAGLIGEARRSYERIGGLRVVGLCVEPVLSSESRGALTWVCDDRGRLWTLPELRPDPAWSPRNVYGRGLSVGGTSVSPKELCRTGLFLQDATASADGRIGTGGGVVAARAGATAWDAAPILSLFERPQDEDAPLVFVRGTLLGVEGDALVVADGQRAWRLVPVLEHPELGARDALRLLARADGASLWVIGRPRGHGVVAALAVGGPGLKLPPELGGRLNLGLDRLLSEHLPPLSERAVEVVRPPDPWDPADEVTRHRLRVALGGPGALPGAARGRVEAQAAALVDAMRPVLAGALIALADAAARRDPEAMARAYVAVALAG
jgi:hypothetical protein